MLTEVIVIVMVAVVVVYVDCGHRNCGGGDGLWLTAADGKGTFFVSFLFLREGVFLYFCLKTFETRMTASVLKQDPNT